jgi:tRNA threonylcarbamoyladenosine biosynthesis protein TsaE
MPDDITIRTYGPEETRAAGSELGRILGSGDIVCLYGELGAGKTTFVQGMALGLGVADKYVTSPTFSLVNEYSGTLTFYHIDLYRLSSTDELEEVGFTEYPGKGVAAVEWPERAGDMLPEDRIDVTITPTGANNREIKLSVKGKSRQELLEVLCRSSQWSRR